MTVEGNDTANKNYLFAMPLLALVLAWGVLITQTRYHWGGESYYNFGWFVPFMAAWLLLGSFSSLRPKLPGSIKPHIVLSGLCLLWVLPFHAFSEVNPFWRLPLWLQAMGLFAFSLIQLHLLFGWQGIRRAVFPLFFLTTMIPWPYRMEVLIVQMLTKVVVILAMNGLHFLGYPVELAGNSFALGDMQIGVNEACSGIRSLQALFMVTLFLGSLFGQGWVRRLTAVLILPLIVIVVNAGRAIFLAMQVIESGEAAYDHWHDPAGYIAFGVSMVLIYACIELFNVGAESERSAKPLSLDRLLGGLLHLRVPRMVVLPVLFPGLMYAAVEGWFRYNEARTEVSNSWHLAVPSAADPSIEIEEIHPQIEAALGFDYGERFFKNLSSRSWCEVYYYGYEPENRLSSVSSYGHSPTICMPSTGAAMDNQFDDLIINVRNGPTLPFKHYLFSLEGMNSKLNVFWTVWEHRNMDISHEELQALDYKTQWIQLLRGRRDFSRQVVLVSVAGMDEPERARQTLRSLFSEWLVAQPD